MARTSGSRPHLALHERGVALRVWIVVKAEPPSSFLSKFLIHIPASLVVTDREDHPPVRLGAASRGSWSKLSNCLSASWATFRNVNPSGWQGDSPDRGYQWHCQPTFCHQPGCLVWPGLAFQISGYLSFLFVYIGIEVIYLSDVGPSAPAVKAKQHASTGKSISEVKSLIQDPSLVLLLPHGVTEFDHSVGSWLIWGLQTGSSHWCRQHVCRNSVPPQTP